MSINKNINSVQDYKAVLKTVQGYVDGLQTGSVEDLKKIFHKEAVMYGFTNDGLSEGSINNLYDYMKEFGKAPNIKTHLDVLGLTPTTAVVQVRMEEDAAGMDFTDFHSLLKVGGKWHVVAKLFHQYDK